MEGKARIIVTMAANIVRCGCGNAASHPGKQCPTPLRTDDLGVARSEREL